jgi:hypothetical protein
MNNQSAHQVLAAAVDPVLDSSMLTESVAAWLAERVGAWLTK